MNCVRSSVCSKACVKSTVTIATEDKGGILCRNCSKKIDCFYQISNGFIMGSPEWICELWLFGDLTVFT